MKTRMLALKTAIFSSVFLTIWALAALSLRRFDAVFGVTLPEAGHTPGIILMGLGALLGISCVATFVRQGKGTPAPFDPPREFVATGPYKYCRNPMYLGGGLMLAGLALLERSISILGFACLVLGVIHVAVVRLEEPGLRKKFGSSFENYCHTIPRWIPRFRRTRTGSARA